MNNIIHEVLFVPKLGANLFSVRVATKKVKVIFDNNRVSIIQTVVGRMMGKWSYWKPCPTWHNTKHGLGENHIYPTSESLEVWRNISRDERDKFSLKARKRTFVGYCETHKVFRLWDSTRRMIFVRRDLIFSEMISDSFSLNLDDTEDNFLLNLIQQYFYTCCWDRWHCHEF